MYLVAKLVSVSTELVPMTSGNQEEEPAKLYSEICMDFKS